jgi:hypothetical protein
VEPSTLAAGSWKGRGQAPGDEHDEKKGREIRRRGLVMMEETQIMI